MDLLTSQPVVIDLGTHSLKAGFGGEDRPAVALRAVVGRPKLPRVVAGGALADADAFVGRRAEEHRGALRLSHALARGAVASWADLEVLWAALYDAQHLKASAAAHPVLLAEAPLTPRAQRERCAQVLFEQLQVPALHCCPSPPLALYATGRTTGLVLDVGEGAAHATPIYEGYALPHAVLRADLGGRDVTERLALLLRKQGTVLHSGAELESVAAMKEAACFVSALPAQDEAAVADRRFAAAEFRLPDGQRLQLGAERFRAPEVLFRPALGGLECRGVAELAAGAALRADLDLRPALLQNVVLAGGSTTCRGFGARLLAELRRLQPAPDVKLRVWAPSEREPRGRPRRPWGMPARARARKRARARALTNRVALHPMRAQARCSRGSGAPSWPASEPSRASGSRRSNTWRRASVFFTALRSEGLAGGGPATRRSGARVMLARVRRRSVGAASRAHQRSAPPAPVAAPPPFPARLLDLDDALDLDGHVERQRVGADGAARVLAFFAEDGAEHVAAAVHDLGLVGEAVDAVHEGHDLDDLLDAAEVAAELGAQRGEDVEADGARRVVRLLGRQLDADLARDEAALGGLGQVARRVDEVADAAAHDVVGRGRARLGQHVAELREPRVDRAAAAAAAGAHPRRRAREQEG